MGADPWTALSARGVAAWLVALLAVPSAASATVTIESAPTSYTGAGFLATANASEPASVVLLEWDFDGDGAFDTNSTGDFTAGHAFAQPGTFVVRLELTREANGSTWTENATRFVTVFDGRPAVTIDVPDRAVATVPQRFIARATDPDPSPAGEPFTYRWTLDGQVVGGRGAEVAISAPAAGRFEVAVEATDAEGLTARASSMIEFVSPGAFEGRSGTVNFSLFVSSLSLAAGLVLVRARRGEVRSRALTRSRSDVLAVEEAVPPRPKAGAPPGKVAFAGASGEASSAPRIALGGGPADLLRTRECPVCHNAIDADTVDCPFCAAIAEADRVEARTAGDAFKEIDLADVRALLGRARRERHLGRLEQHRVLLQEASARADELLKEQGEASEWVPRARAAFDAADPTSGGEGYERAQSYLKLAESLLAAHQNAKAARHARRVMELLRHAEAAEEGTDRCPACGGAVAGAVAAGATECPHCGAALGSREGGQPPQTAAALEAQVRSEIRSIRAEVQSKQVEIDQETWKLLEAAESFERVAEWGQSLEILRTLRERLERERALGQPEGQSERGGGGSPPPTM